MSRKSSRIRPGGATLVPCHGAMILRTTGVCVECVEVQMYLEGDLQEIEVTSQEPSCADLAAFEAGLAPRHHGTMAPWPRPSHGL